MAVFSAADSAFMARAVALAARGRYTAHPNPMVGCVLVTEGDVVGEGWHEVAGEAHAEIRALESAGARASGATAYVTLEPCVHHGKTPPCVDALVKAGVREVVAAIEDPYPRMRGKGITALREAGIAVRVGLMEAEVRHLLAGFISRTSRGRPLVRLKIAASLDGCTGMRNGDSHWITGPDARADVQRLRAQAGAIVTGIGTVLADDPSFTVRAADIDTRGRQPLRGVLDPQLRIPVTARMLGLPGETVVYCSDDSNRGVLAHTPAEIVRIGTAAGELDLGQVLSDMAAREINEILVEAGPRLAGSFMTHDLIDELVIYQSPHIMGSETLPMFSTPDWTVLADRRELEIIEMRRVGRDLRITARLAREA